VTVSSCITSYTTIVYSNHVPQDVLALLRDYQITNIGIDHREHFYTREAGPQLLQPVNDLDPLVDVVSPLIPVLGLKVATIFDLRYSSCQGCP
jgi:hypothetical protein